MLLKGQKKKKKNKKKEEKERKREEEQERHYQAQGNSSKSRIFTYRWMLVTQWKEERTNPPFPFSRRAKRQRRRNQIHLSLSSLAWPRHHTYRDQTSSGEILGQYLTRPAYLVKVRYETFGHHVTETFGADKMRGREDGPTGHCASVCADLTIDLHVSQTLGCEPPNNGKVSSWLRPAHCRGALQLGLPLEVKNSEFGHRLVASSRLGRARNFRSL